MSRKPFNAFTLAELLITLAILGVIATFTIPKVLQSQQDGRNKAIVKETAGMVSGAWEAYKRDHSVSTTAGFYDLTPYMNYVAFDTTTRHDDLQTLGFQDCQNNYPCIRLANGALIRYDNRGPAFGVFGNSATTNAIWYAVDPDGKYSGATDGPGKGVFMFQYYNGRVADYGSITPNTRNLITAFTPQPALVPPWFSWD